MKYVSSYIIILTCFSLVFYISSCKKDDEQSFNEYHYSYSPSKDLLAANSENEMEPYYDFNPFEGQISFDVDGDNINDFLFKCKESRSEKMFDVKYKSVNYQKVTIESINPQYTVLSYPHNTIMTRLGKCKLLWGDKGITINKDLITDSLNITSKDSLTFSRYTFYQIETHIGNGVKYIPFTKTVTSNQYLMGWIKLDYSAGHVFPKSHIIDDYLLLKSTRLKLLETYIGSKPNPDHFILGETGQ